MDLYNQEIQEKKKDLQNQPQTIKKMAIGTYACNAGDLDSIPTLGGSLQDGKCYPLRYSGLEKPMSLQRVGHNCTTSTIHNNVMFCL